MARPRKPQGRDAIMAQVKTVGAGMATLTKLLEEHGSHISEKEFGHLWAHLSNTHGRLFAQSTKDRLLISAGEFSFDSPVPPIAQSVAVAAQTPLPAPAPNPLPTPAPPAPAPPLQTGAWKKPFGRVSKNSPTIEARGDLVREAIPLAVDPSELSAQFDPKHKGVIDAGFIASSD